MKRVSRRTGREPTLGGRHSRAVNGREPALGEAFLSPYGPVRIPGLEAPTVSGRRRPLVVVAEFDSDTAELVNLLAGSNGYDIRRTDDGREAWAMVRALEPNLLVANHRLPGFDGLDLVRRVRQAPDPLLALMPIVIMDVRHRYQDVMDAFLCGADDYLEKPYNDIRLMLVCWRRAIAGLRRPSPLTALLNEDAMIRQVALSCILEQRPPGLIDGLADLLWQPDAQVQVAAKWALQRIGTPEALAALRALNDAGWNLGNAR